MTHEKHFMINKFKSQCPSVKFYWDTDIFIYLSFVCGHKHYSIKAELNSGNRDSDPAKH